MPRPSLARQWAESTLPYCHLRSRFTHQCAVTHEGIYETGSAARPCHQVMTLRLSSGQFSLCDIQQNFLIKHMGRGISTLF